MAVRLVGKLTLVSPPDLHPPYHDIISEQASEVIDTGSTTPYGERIYIRPEWVVDAARDLGMVSKESMEAVLEEERAKKVEIEKVLKEVLGDA